MVGRVASVVCVLFIGYLLWRDLRKDQESISWAPLVWMFFAGSRYASSWLNLRASGVVVDAYADGSPVDRAVFFLLILWGGTVLLRRNIQWTRLILQNKWLAAYFAYCLFSITWTEEPYILAKRWVKDLGNPIMALVMLTERRPYDAIATTLRRLSFLLAPLSVLFIRYYPALGRSYAKTGDPMYTGVGQQKNTLGLMCLITGIGYAWTFLQKRSMADRFTLVVVVMIAWLLSMANSATSLLCLIVAVGVLVLSRMPVVSNPPTRILAVTVAAAALYPVADALFQVKSYILALVGRDASLTNRTDVWSIVSGFQSNALIGTGFMSFWTGDRMAAILAELGTGINQAHNGYLEQYLNLGYVGVAFIVAIVLSALWDVRKQLRTDRQSAMLRLCIIVSAMLYNYTEASFYGINNMWVLMLAGSIDRAGVCGAESVAAVAIKSRASTRPGVSVRGLPVDLGSPRHARHVISQQPHRRRERAAAVWMKKRPTRP